MRGIPLILLGILMLGFGAVNLFATIIYPPVELREPYSIAVMSSEPLNHFYFISEDVGSFEDGNFRIANYSNVDVYVNDILVPSHQDVVLMVDNTKPVVAKIMDEYGVITYTLENGMNELYLSEEELTIYAEPVSVIGHADLNFENAWIDASMPSSLMLVENDNTGVFVIENVETYLIHVRGEKYKDNLVLYIALGREGASVSGKCEKFWINIPKDVGVFELYTQGFFSQSGEGYEENIHAGLLVRSMENVKMNVSQEFADKKFVYGEDNGYFQLKVRETYVWDGNEREDVGAILIPASVLWSGVVTPTVEKAKVNWRMLLLALGGVVVAVLGLALEATEKKGRFAWR
jgi:hypothetical protein